MMQKMKLLTIFLIILINSFVLARGIATNGGAFLSRSDLQKIKNKISTLEQKTNALENIIREQDQQITNYINLTNAYMAIVQNRIDFTDTILERSEVYRELVKIEKKRSFFKGLGIGAAAGATAVILLVKGIKEIKNSSIQTSFINSQNLKPGGPYSHFIIKF